MRNALKSIALLAAVGFTTLSFTGLSMADEPTTNPAHKMAPAVRGKIEKVDGTKITVMTRDGEKVVDTDDSTKFTLDGKPATLADLKADERVAVTPESGVAAEVKATTANRKRKDKDGSKEPTTAPAGHTTVAPADAK